MWNENFKKYNAIMHQAKINFEDAVTRIGVQYFTAAVDTLFMLEVVGLEQFVKFDFSLEVEAVILGNNFTRDELVFLFKKLKNEWNNGNHNFKRLIFKGIENPLYFQDSALNGKILEQHGHSNVWHYRKLVGARRYYIFDIQLGKCYYPLHKFESQLFNLKSFLAHTNKFISILLTLCYQES